MPVGRHTQALIRDFPPAALPHIPALAEGRAEAVAAVMAALPPYRRGELAAALYQDGLGAAGLRAALDFAWPEDRDALARHCLTERRLKSMIAAAGFPIDLPAQNDVWRGTNGLSRGDAERGLSWTLSRAAACIAAMDGSGAPLVLKSRVRRSQVLWLREGGEVVLSRPGLVEIDGTAADWAEIATKQAAS